MFPDLTNPLADFPKTCIFKLFSLVLYKKTHIFVTGSILLTIIVSDVFQKSLRRSKKNYLFFAKKLISLNNLEFKKLARALVRQFLFLL